MSKDYIEFTLITSQKYLSQIDNFRNLPELVRAEINAFSELTLNAAGHQELNGYQNRRMVFSFGGYWESASQFIAQSYGSKSLQWNESEGVKRLNQAS